jgi:peroxiredoxin
MPSLRVIASLKFSFKASKIIMNNHLKPKTQAPELSFELTSGETWNLNDQNPESFTMIVFHRGLHCPVCKGYLRKLNQLIDDYEKHGVNVVAVSMENEERALKSVQEWKISNLDVGFGLTEEQARQWGIYLSEGINDEEPDLFSEPGLFLVRPDDELYYAAVNSMAFGRPNLEEMLEAINFVQTQNYPARGEH